MELAKLERYRWFSFPMLNCFTELHNLHIRSGVLEYSSCSKPVYIQKMLRKMTLTDMKLVVTPEAVRDLKPDSALISTLAHGGVASFENCTFEVVADSPQLMHLTACQVGRKSKVGGPGLLLSAAPDIRSGMSSMISLGCTTEPSCTLAHLWVQMTLNNCKIQGFWRALHVVPEATACLTNCKVDLTTAHAYSTVEIGNSVVGVWMPACIQTDPDRSAAWSSLRLDEWPN
jgi:hypothetical protein